MELLKNRWSLFYLNQLVEHLCFLILIILAIVFSEERLLADSGFYLFKVVNQESFWIEHNRFILLFSQILPCLGVKIGCSLKTLIILYSVGHVLFFYSLFLIGKYYFKLQEIGIYLLLLQTLGIASGFFVPMFELYYASGFLILFYLLYQQNISKGRLLLLFILAFFIITAHLFALILFLQILALQIIVQGRTKIKYAIIFSLFALICIWIKSTTAEEYEQEKMAAFFHQLSLFDYDMAYLKKLFQFIYIHYTELSFIVVTILVFLIFKKQYIYLGFFLMGVLSLLILITCSFYELSSGRYQEQVYFPLSVFVIFALMVFVFRQLNSKAQMLVSFLMVIVFVIRLFTITDHGKLFTSRIVEMKKWIEWTKKENISKYVVNENILKYDANWSYPIETMLLSSADSDHVSVTICTDTDYKFQRNDVLLSKDNYLFRRWDIEQISDLNSAYFNLKRVEYQKLVLE